MSIRFWQNIEYLKNQHVFPYLEPEEQHTVRAIIQRNSTTNVILGVSATDADYLEKLVATVQARRASKKSSFESLFVKAR